MVNATVEQTPPIRRPRTRPAPGTPSTVQSGPSVGNDIAQLLIQEGFLTPERLTYARRVQSKLATPKTLVQVLQEIGCITDEQLRHTLRTHHGSIRIGELLVELGHLRQADLEAALNIQQSMPEKKKLGDLLVENHFIDEQQFAEVLSYQLGFHYVEPNLTEIDRDLLARVPLKQYAEHNLIPVSRQDGRVVVAFADPLDTREREFAEQCFGKDLVIAMATRRSIREALAHIARGAIQRATATAPDEQQFPELS